MTKKLSYALLTLIAVSLLASGAAFAQCPMSGKGACPNEDKGNAGMEMPKFTPEQEKQMMDLKVTLIKETEPLKTEMKLKGMELMALWKEDNPDAKKILAKVREVGEIKIKLQEKMINHKLAMFKILTPEQKTMMKGMMGMGCEGFDCCDVGEKCGMMGGAGCGKGGGKMGGACGEGGCSK
jgi:Spy/CpxP family protein refolding chaperone